MQLGITASEYWQLYFTNRLAIAKRTSEGVEGHYVVEGENIGPFVTSELRAFNIGLRALREYEYSSDERFIQFLKYPRSTSSALELLSKKTYPFLEHPPFGSVRMAELASGLLNNDTIKKQLESAQNFDLLPLVNSMLKEQPDVLHNQSIDVLIWIAGEKRCPTASDSLVSLMQDGLQYRQTDKRRISTSRLIRILESLSKIGNRSVGNAVMDFWESVEYSLRSKIAALFKRLYSRHELLSALALPSEYMSSSFWKKQILGYEGLSPKEKVLFGFSSFFWDLRYLSFVRVTEPFLELPLIDTEEVSLVYEMAASKLKSK